MPSRDTDKRKQQKPDTYSVRSRAKAYFASHMLFRDQLFLLFLILLGLTCIVVWLIILANVSESSVKVFLRYSAIEGPNSPGFGESFHWTSAYKFGLFSLIATTLNMGVALAVYEKSRVSSFLVVVGGVAVNMFTLIVTYSLLTQVFLEN